jgi:hypothetical protein
MCPFCLANIGLIIASATSAGGLTALAVKLSRKKKIFQSESPRSASDTKEK